MDRGPFPWTSETLVTKVRVHLWADNGQIFHNPGKGRFADNPGPVSWVPACILHLSTSDGRTQNLDWHTLENMRGGEAANGRKANFERKGAR